MSHAQTPADLAELLVQVLSRDLETVHIPANPHEEHILYRIGVLVQVDDIAAVIEDPVCDGGDDPFGVLALDQRSDFGSPVGRLYFAHVVLPRTDRLIKMNSQYDSKRLFCKVIN